MKLPIKFKSLLESRSFPNYIFLVVLFVSSALWLAFFPRFYANVDEHNYLRSAWKIGHIESLNEDSSFQSLGGFANHEGEFISKYNIGASLWYAIPTLFGLESALLFSLLTYLLILFVCRELLREFKISPYWIIVLAFYPPLIYFSRTTLSELPATLFFLASYLAFLRIERAKGYAVLLGITLGMLTLTRYNFALWAVILVLLLLVKFKSHINDKVKLKTLGYKAGLVFFSALPFLLALLLINIELYGSPFSSGYKFSGEQRLDTSLFADRFPYYILYLNLLYPGQLFFFSYSKRPLVQALGIFTYMLIIFYSLTAGGYLFQGDLIVDLTAGVRFFLPVLPAILLHYFSYIEEVYSKLKKTDKLRFLPKLDYILLLALPLLTMSSCYLHFKHADFLRERAKIANIVHEYTEPATLFVGDEEDYIYLGEHLAKNSIDFDSSGYMPVADFTQLENAENLPTKFETIYLFEISYSSNPDRPTSQMLKSIAALEQSTEIVLIRAEENIKIYEYRQK